MGDSLGFAPLAALPGTAEPCWLAALGSESGGVTSTGGASREGVEPVVETVAQIVADVAAAKSPRVSLVVKADIRPGVTDGLTSKVETVERYLGES